MNLTDEPFSSYTRSVQSFVSPEGAAPIEVWEKEQCDGQSAHIVSLDNLSLDISPCGDERAVEWVANGCANCHSMDATGSSVGPNALAADSEKIAENVRFGPYGMPAHDEEGMTNVQLALIQDYLGALSAENPQSVPTPVPTPIPTPVPTPTVVAVATPAPGATAPDSDVLAIGKKIYDETAGDVGCAHCHGLDGAGQGTGGDNTPDIRGMGRSQVRGAIRDVLDMNDIDLTSDELLAVVEYMRVLGEQ
jgi:mono/diheme cytochrome c family protein